MLEYTGWLFDIYETPLGVGVWLLTDDDQRFFFQLAFEVTFYAAGPRERLRAAWKQAQNMGMKTSREIKQDLFSGYIEVLAITAPNPRAAANAFSRLSEIYNDLTYYDGDVPIQLRFAARTGVMMLHHCRIRADGAKALEINLDEAPSDPLSAISLPLRVLELGPDVDPSIGVPEKLAVKHGTHHFTLNLHPKRGFETALGALLKRVDPDLILTDFGDTWLFPMLALNPNRDLARDVLRRKASSFFTYGMVMYRGEQAHLFGRWHIDRKNAALFKEYGVDGVIEQARITGMGAQEVARKSPGSGITAMQMITALRTDVLVPVVKQQAESFKTLKELVSMDKGGMVYQPIPGVYDHVAQIDFASMYPSIMVQYNISPETNGKEDAPDGLVPQTLRPLLEQRLAIKRALIELHPKDERVKSLKSRAAALKWLLVVCFGYLGYKNARFGKIESHEAVTSISRELLLRSKEIAEDMGFTVLHMYVDSLFVRKEGARTAADITPLLDEIVAQTNIAIAMDGIYRWVAFLPSKMDIRSPVPNRYFGVFQDDEMKYRGIELRRHDTPLWVAGVQLALLKELARAKDLEQARDFIPRAILVLNKAKNDLRRGHVTPETLVIRQRISKGVEEYKAFSPTARAARILSDSGQKVAPGQNIRFVYTRGKPGVQPLGMGVIDPKMIDIDRYVVLLDRAAETILSIFGEGYWEKAKNTYTQKSWLIPQNSGAKRIIAG